MDRCDVLRAAGGSRGPGYNFQVGPGTAIDKPVESVYAIPGASQPAVWHPNKRRGYTNRLARKAAVFLATIPGQGERSRCDGDAASSMVDKTRAAAILASLRHVEAKKAKRKAVYLVSGEVRFSVRLVREEEDKGRNFQDALEKARPMSLFEGMKGFEGPVLVNLLHGI